MSIVLNTLSDLYNFSERCLINEANNYIESYFRVWLPEKSNIVDNIFYNADVSKLNRKIIEIMLENSYYFKPNLLMRKSFIERVKERNFKDINLWE